VAAPGEIVSERLVHRRAANGSSIAASGSPSSMFASALSQRTAA
jgi:hypothetical protein